MSREKEWVHCKNSLIRHYFLNHIPMYTCILDNSVNYFSESEAQPLKFENHCNMATEQLFKWLVSASCVVCWWPVGVWSQDWLDPVSRMLLQAWWGEKGCGTGGLRAF